MLTQSITFRNMRSRFKFALLAACLWVFAAACHTRKPAAMTDNGSTAGVIGNSTPVDTSIHTPTPRFTPGTTPNVRPNPVPKPQPPVPPM